MLAISIIGCGGIGAGVLRGLAAQPGIRVESIVVPPEAATREHARALAAQYAPAARLVDSVDPDRDRPDLIVECAGHRAIRQHVLPGLRSGIACLLVSVGALSEDGLVDELEQATLLGGTQVQLLPGAIGAIDALAAARLGGLSSVRYTGRKPPSAWSGTPAQQLCDLCALREPAMLFAGSAREAAALYPKNANVAATVSLAGLGLSATYVELYADPGVSENVHQVDAVGAFGSFSLTMRGRPLPENPKTSALTVYSVLRALANRVNPVSI